MSKWREVRLGEVIMLKRGYDLPLSKSELGKYPVIAASDLRGYHSDFKALPPVITLGRSGSIGDVQIVFTKAWPLNTTLYVKKFNGNNKIFIYYLLKTIDFRRFNSGAGVPTLNRNHLNKLKIKIPDLETQEKIAQVLSSYDELIENNNRRIELLENMAEEIYKEWFVRMRFPGHEEVSFEKGIPEGWEVKRVKDVVDRLKAGHYYKEHEVSEVGDTIVIDQSEKTFLGFHSNDPDHIADIDSPIILFGDHSCKMNLMIRNFSVSENVVPFKSVEKNNEIFLFYATKRLVETQEYKRHWTEFTNKKIFIPSDILKSKFINNVRDIIIQVEKYKEQNQNLIKQRDMLLPRLMNGTIEVK